MLASRLFRQFRVTTLPATRSFRKTATMSAKSDPSRELDQCSLEQLYKDDVLKKVAIDGLLEPDQELNQIVHLYQGDITKLTVDAIVNAANTWLLGGGGVDGSIHRAAGPALKEECRTLDGCDTGDAKITKGYELPAKHVIHAVGPVYTEKMGEKNAELLASCYWKSMQLATDNRCRSIAFPCISTGVYGYPHQAAAEVAADTVKEFLLGADNKNQIDKVIFCTYLDVDKKAYIKAIPEFYPPVEKQAENGTEADEAAEKAADK